MDVIFWWLLVTQQLPDIPWYVWVMACISEAAEWVAWWNRRK